MCHDPSTALDVHLLASTRREFLGTALATVWLSKDRLSLHRWWPRFPMPTEVWIVPEAGNLQEGILLESAAGLLARAALRSSKRVPTPMIYEEVASESYRLSFAAYCKEHSPHLVRLSLDDAIGRLRDMKIANGYLLYRYDSSTGPLHEDLILDESANVATSLCGGVGGLAVSEGQVERIERLGLGQIQDVRRDTEASCLKSHEALFSRDLLGACDPRARHARSLMIALGAFVCSSRGETYRRALARCLPDSPVLGWGCGLEDAQTIPSSRAGLYQTATDWCHNLPLFASEDPARLASRLRVPVPPHWSQLEWGDGHHYAALVMSDGDNVQWEMANFARGQEGASYYDHPLRGKIPFGWGINVPTLAQLAPRVLEDILGRATRNDGFLMFGGAGYFYADIYGADQGKQVAAARHADRLRGYMDLSGIRAAAFNFQGWDSAAALKACSTMALKLPGLEGIFAFQYFPYSAGKGAVRWVRGANADEVPVASCSLCIWANTSRPRETTPAGVAFQLNKLEKLGQRPATDGCFSWVLVHAWSRFRKAPPGSDLLSEETGVDQSASASGTRRGYGPALWAADRLESHVKLVTPNEWLLRVRLRLRPRATLTQYLAEVRKEGKSGRVTTEIERLLGSADADPRAARACFEKLREVSRH